METKKVKMLTAISPLDWIVLADRLRKDARVTTTTGPSGHWFNQVLTCLGRLLEGENPSVVMPRSASSPFLNSVEAALRLTYEILVERYGDEDYGDDCGTLVVPEGQKLVDDTRSCLMWATARINDPDAHFDANNNPITW